jgi:hypothetical protein
MVIVRGELQYIETWESERFITGAGGIGGISGIRPILVKIMALHIHNVPCHSSSNVLRCRTANVIMIRGHMYLRVW